MQASVHTARTIIQYVAYVYPTAYLRRHNYDIIIINNKL